MGSPLILISSNYFQKFEQKTNFALKKKNCNTVDIIFLPFFLSLTPKVLEQWFQTEIEFSMKNNSPFIMKTKCE